MIFVGVMQSLEEVNNFGMCNRTFGHTAIIIYYSYYIMEKYIISDQVQRGVSRQS